MTDWTLDVTRLDAIVPPEGLRAEPGYEDQDPLTSHGFPEYRLRKLAEAATPGPWAPLTHGTASQRDAAGRAYEAVAVRHLPDNPEVQFTDLSWVDLADGTHVALIGNGRNGPENAAYIAAVSPDVVLRLLDDLEAADRAVAALTPLVESVRAILDELDSPGGPGVWADDETAQAIVDGLSGRAATPEPQP